MMKIRVVNSLSKAAFFALLLSFINSAKAQDTTNATIDSLIMLLMNDSEDTARVNVYNALSNEYITLDYTKSLDYSQLGLDLAEDLKYKEGILEAKMDLAHLNLSFLLDYPLAKKYYEQALVIAQSIKNQEAELIIYRGLSNIYRFTNNIELAKSYNQKAMDIAVSMDNYPYMSDLNSYMGGLYEQSGDTVKAIDYYAEVLAIERKNDFRETTNAAMIVIARYYFLINDHGQSLKYYRIALKNFERLNDHRWVSYTHSEMALIYVIKGDLKRAEQHALKGLEIAEANKLRKELGDNYQALHQIYTEMDSMDKAEDYARAFDSLQDSLKPIEETIQALEDNKKTGEGEKSSNKMNGFLMAILLCLPVMLVVFLTGMPAKKKN